VVVGLAQGGKAGFLKERTDELQKLLQNGVMVVLPDLRGTGETRGGTSRGREGGDTNWSVHAQLFGETMLGQRLRDLRAVLEYLRTRPDVNAKNIALWGDSFAPTNSKKTDFKVPHAVESYPKISEPLGGLLALLGGLFEDDVRAVYVSGGLLNYREVLSHFAVLIPHDAAVPGVLRAGDLCDLAGSLAPRPLFLGGLIDHLNCPVALKELQAAYQPTRETYGNRNRALVLAEQRGNAGTWLSEQLLR
jgi:hypothetical protein